MPQVPQAPQHPSSQQGLEPNPYYKPNASLEQSTQRITGEDQLRLAQAEQAGAMAGKARAEADMLGALSGLGNPIQAGPEVMPQEVQAQQLAGGILSGEISPEMLTQGVQSGEISQEVAQAAMGMAQQEQANTESQYTQQQGLGPI